MHLHSGHINLNLLNYSIVNVNYNIVNVDFSYKNGGWMEVAFQSANGWS